MELLSTPFRWNMSSEQLKRMIQEASAIVAFTGAGVSAESGIPTYRGSDGVWNKYDPDKYANVNEFTKDPSYYWSFFREVRYPVLKAAAPNAAHRLLARMEEQGKLRAVITQNIDGLHQEAGSRNVLELHGNTRTFACMSCGQTYTLEGVRVLLESELPPPCSTCQGLIKPAVVMFGEPLPGDILREAEILSRNCDLFLAIGSSLLVQPAASMPLIAKRSGAKLVIVNKDATRLDAMADLVIQGTASQILTEALAEKSS
jgi:NAD-dependent deacetylase